MLYYIIAAALGLLLFILGYLLRVGLVEKSFSKAKSEAQRIIEDAENEAKKYTKTVTLEVKKEMNDLKKETEKDIRERKSDIVRLEETHRKREEALDRRSEHLDGRELSLDKKETKLSDKKRELEENNSKLNKVLESQEKKLFEISSLTEAEAKEIIMKNIEDKMEDEIASYIRDEEDKAKSEADEKAKNLIALAMQKYASDVVSERAVTVVNIPSEDMKGRIIGREGRNIRTLEALTGVDLIIDDTPEAIVLSGFDPLRRTIAKLSLEKLIEDGRIHPTRIEEVVNKTRNEMENFIRDKGSKVVFDLGIGKMHPDLVKLIGKLHFRSSYGQNALQHSVETAYICGKLASELGEDEVLAKRAGLLHDIGKSIDHEIEGSHVDIGMDLAKRYKEPKDVIGGIGYHHGDYEATSVIQVLVAVADAISAARPGARSESTENYIKRLAELEKISKSVDGVEEAYALQAGRELRILVKSDKISDSKMTAVARNIKEQIENNLTYPGTIKVTVIRETRAYDTAK